MNSAKHVKSKITAILIHILKETTNSPLKRVHQSPQL